MRWYAHQAVSRLRENALCVLLAGLGTAAMAWLGLYGFAWSDYEVEALPALRALTNGHVDRFLALAPAYGGSLVLRAPFALIPGLWGGGDLAVYRMVALPCLLAAAALGVWLVAHMRLSGHGRLARALVLGLCVTNPLTLRALEVGHPEELLGGVLCVLAVLLASREHPVLAGLTLGAAIANKEWALLAVGPVLLALPAKRALCIAVASALTAAVLAPLALLGSSTFVASARGAASAANAIFQPWQLWWFLGHHGPLVHGLFGDPKPGYRVAPLWVTTVSHPLIIALMPIMSLALLLRERGVRARARMRIPDAPPPASVGSPTLTDALLLLALLLLGRCMLDVWDTSYYLLPFLLALVVWETFSHRRPAALSLAVTAIAWVDFQWLAVHASADLQSAFFLAWSVPLATLLALRLYAPGWSEALLGGPASSGLPRASRRVLLTRP